MGCAEDMPMEITAEYLKRKKVITLKMSSISPVLLYSAIKDNSLPVFNVLWLGMYLSLLINGGHTEVCTCHQVTNSAFK